MATLNDIAKKIGDLTVAYAPKKTGNLKRQLKKQNTPKNILGEKPEEKLNVKTNTKYGLEFTVDYAPPGAEYGKFVEEGHKTRKKAGGKGKARVKPNPFAEKAINDDQVEKMILEYLDTLAADVAEKVADNIVSELNK